MNPKVEQPESEQATTPPADVAPVVTSIWSPIREVEKMTAADWFRLYNAAIETVRLPDGSFQSSWYRGKLIIKSRQAAKC